MNKALFIDRDDTIIRDPGYLNCPEDIEYMPEVYPSIRQIFQSDYLIVVITNQSGIPRKLISKENLFAIHRRLRFDFLNQGIPISRIYFAPFLPETESPLRKPGTGMLQWAAQDLRVDLDKSWMIGDKKSDKEAAQNAGCQFIRYEPHKTLWSDIAKSICTKEK